MSDALPPQPSAGIDWDAAPSDIVAVFRNLAERAPRTASALVDRVAAAAEPCRAARVNFAEAVGALIVMLPSEGARYPVQVLADLVEDDAMDVREAAVDVVANLVSVLPQDHLQQCSVLLRTVRQRFETEEHVWVREQAGVTCLLFGFALKNFGPPYLTAVAWSVAATLPEKAAERVFERVSELWEVNPRSLSVSVPD